MKAAVLHEAGGVPRYEDFPDPVAADGEVIIDVKAVAVENVDKAIAAGTHYAGEKYIGRFPVIPAFDGVGALPDGTLVGFGGIRLPYGALAEKTVVPQGSYVPIPEGVDPAVASVMASAVTAMSMEAAAGFVPGETVLVLGATGVAGRLAVKVARLLGAGRIVATGRDDHQLREVRAIGADAVINTAVSDEALARAYLDARGDGYDVVLDYLWGRPSEILLRALVPRSFAFGKPTRVVQIGESAGAELTLAASSLRTSGAEIYGAAKGLDPRTMEEVYQRIVTWTRSGELTFDMEKVPLSDIETAWQRTNLKGRRLVVMP
ncbi:quinone oxidoreductase family protein [Microbispora bryophytorum]|uniref:Zinc-binding alcohol dehydrogenase family protein n=1 Tax=Microbispora bryophytorum subsp. camponoti TaxID=1677852 RepID=A0ABR8KU64_9ACTN|nr:zinc-binding alcohol dehydrogenase family protein [Microbispora camponoti]MBD3142296.1 zinc-binding alcohol dehydrogenase family protein [Microbispora camponoti]